jgi:hypothetical protein
MLFHLRLHCGVFSLLSRSFGIIKPEFNVSYRVVERSRLSIILIAPVLVAVHVAVP